MTGPHFTGFPWENSANLAAEICAPAIDVQRYLGLWQAWFDGTAVEHPPALGEVDPDPRIVE